MNTWKSHKTWDSDSVGGELKSWKAWEYIGKSQRWGGNNCVKEDFCLCVCHVEWFSADVCEGMGSLVQLQPKSVIVAILIAAKRSVGNDLVVSLQSYE